jgi:hypothetical protein
MALGIPGFSAPTAGFEVPLEMLAACHGRIRGQCSTLLRLRSHVANAGADAAACDAARGVIRYFDTAARDHHEDEERDLFPALLESMAGSDPVCLRELIESLKNDHRDLERLWGAVRAWLAAVERGEAAPHEGTRIDAFVDLYERTPCAKRRNCSQWPSDCLDAKSSSASAGRCACGVGSHRSEHTKHRCYRPRCLGAALRLGKINQQHNP